MVCGRGMWFAEFKNFHLRLKADTWNQLPAASYSSSDNLNDCNTKANPKSLLTKGCESLTVNYQMSIWASLEMESVNLVFNPHVHTKTKTNVIDNQILGAFTFWPTYKVVHFPKIRTHEKAWRLCFGKKGATQEVGGFARHASWDAGHALVPDRLLCSMLFRWCFRPCAVPPASDRSSSTPTKTRVKVAFVRTGLEGETRLDRPDKGIIHLTGCAARLLLLFS